ncbi:winged helix-turn-helix transcriptional regulator [Bacillus sp. BRMEA1]|uniref:autorepressor SdpR family transcription factor n=1 Tax=Neobacillus endophyticus TaxID=2738405 RepID=UPI001567192D|nr:autorepressor SdpR family transcription factor [Neobacillus endophyticus]NRD77745.1 winged helix-turn-helix transcriptional regulator [Neobacillus endophyticus]
MNEVFKALADPTRRKILDLLKERDLTAGEIADHFEMSKPSISNHLKILKSAGLVLDDKQGQFVLYSLNSTILQDVIKWLLDKKGNGDE